jgi:signal transduction histidine kinase
MKRDFSAEKKSKITRAHYGDDGGLFEKEGIRNRYMFGDSGKRSDAELMVYRDKDGLPVIYDAATHNRERHASPDDLSVLWHEILSPLTVIKGYTGTMLELGDTITEEQKMQYLRGIESASNRMLRLIENLRDISHMEKSDVWVTHSIYLNDILRHTVPEMQRQTTKHVIKINPVERLPLVKAEPEKIEQVISNLIINAIKYSPEGGEISVAVRLVRDEQELDRMFGDTPEISLPCLVVSIADEGIGIPEAELDNIFERFYRVNDQIIKSTPGAGLGLYISKMIVEGHGGHIWARNRSQGGSVFHFSLPLEQKITRRYKDYHQ